MRTLASSLFFITLAALTFLAAPALAQDRIDPAALPCTDCHNETTLIVSKQAQFHHSTHGAGDAWVRGESERCSGCHGSEAASARIAAGQMPHDASIQGVLNVSPYNCRTCHEIHKTYTLDDFAIVGGAEPVELEMTGSIYNGGAGNLCVNCHQIRNELPVAANGEIVIDTTRFGPHHGIEAEMMLGEGGLGLRSRPNVHYKEVLGTCTDCHMGHVPDPASTEPLSKVARNHTFEAEVGYCQACHQDVEDFDYQGIQTRVKGLLEEVRPLLIAKGIMDGSEGRENRSVEGTYPEEVANAMWNYMVVLEDGSNGVHHPDWAIELLEYARDVLSE